MQRLGDVAVKVRSKNAGPFWLTVDIFCGTNDVFDRVSKSLTTDAVAGALDTPAANLKRFDIPDLSVVKFSLPRPAVQGSAQDRDMHGASYAVLIADLPV